MKRLKKEKILTILSLSFPIIIENILQTLLGTTDTYFAGKLADNAIAGISITNIIMNILFPFLQLSVLVQPLLFLEIMVNRTIKKQIKSWVSLFLFLQL